jgi:transposase
MRLVKRGIELIVPHKAKRVRKPTQDGRSLRRDRKRWKIEPTNAWLGNFRRPVVRYERYLHTYQVFFHIACS